MTKCLKCKIKEVEYNSFCQGCFIKYFIKKVRKAIRTTLGLKKSDRILVILQKNSVSLVLKSVLCELFSKSSIYYETVLINDLNTIDTNNFNKFVMPNCVDDFSKTLLNSFFNNESLSNLKENELIKPFEDRIIYVFNELTKEEIQKYAQFSNLEVDFSVEKESDTDIFLHSFDKENFQINHSLKKSYESIKDLL